MDRTAREPSPVALDEPRITLEMGGQNVVIRSTAAIDQACTASLAHAINAAVDTDTVAVIDPDPIRCDDVFANEPHLQWDVACSEHQACRPVPVEVLAAGIIRIRAERTTWHVDVAAGRFCQTEGAIDHHFLPASAWTPVVAVCVTPTRLRALTAEGTLVSSNRAHVERVPVTA